MDMMALLPLAALLLVIGAAAGVIAGLLGVGGGIILVPAFLFTFNTLGYGGSQVMQVCLATSLATIIVTSIRSVMSHNKKGAVDWQILRTWAPGVVLGAVLGVLVAAQLRSVVLQGIFGFFGVMVGLYLGFGKADWRLGAGLPTGARRAGLSGFIGFMSVLMGVGGGSFAVPTLSLYGQPIHRAVATAAGFGLLIALPSAIAFLLVQIPDHSRPPLTVGAVNLPAFGIVILMTVLTAPLGARLAHAMDPKPLRRVFAIFIVLVALNMLRKTLMG